MTRKHITINGFKLPVNSIKGHIEVTPTERANVPFAQGRTPVKPGDTLTIIIDRVHTIELDEDTIGHLQPDTP